ncbi:MAG: Eco57I restriction-modification methylase domain-containing protein [Alphaproteobacteria bacterium]
MQNFEEIKTYFNDLNHNYNHFENSNDICTPIECVKEMVDSIPASFWKKKDLKVFDSCCGNGNFHAYINMKTNLKNLYFNEINEKRISNVKKYFGDKINITNKDFLTFEEKETYDLVVSNPPYAKFTNGIRASKNHNLSRDFIKKALKITKKGGYILFIVPNNWMSFSDRNVLPKELSKYQFIHLDINGAKKWFPKVGSSFTWFLLHKVPNKNPFKVNNNYILKDEQIVKIDKEINFIPLYLNNLTMNIINKVVNSQTPKYKIETTSFLHKTTKKDFIRKEKNSKYKYKLIHTPSQTVWSSIPHKYQDGYKVFLSLTNQYGTFIDNCGMTQSVAFVRCENLKKAKKIQKELENPIYKFTNNITRYGNFNNIRVLQKLSKLKDIKLNIEELDFIKNFNERYYRGKK